MQTFLVALGAAVFGGVVTMLVQHRLAQREREHAVYRRLAEALADAEFATSGVHPDRFIFGGPEEWQAAIDDVGEEVRRARRELMVASFLAPRKVAGAIGELIPAVSTAWVETVRLLRLMSSNTGADSMEQRAKAMAANEAAVAAWKSTSDLVRSGVNRPLVGFLR